MMRPQPLLHYPLTLANFMSTCHKLESLEKEASIEKMPQQDLTGGKPVGYFLNQWLMGRDQPIVVGGPGFDKKAG